MAAMFDRADSRTLRWRVAVGDAVTNLLRFLEIDSQHTAEDQLETGQSDMHAASVATFSQTDATKPRANHYDPLGL